MKLTWILSLAAISAVVSHADTIELSTGKTIPGSVINYANMTFEVQDEKGTVTRLASASVRSIQFGTNGIPASLETRTGGKREGTLSRYDKSAFSFQPAKGPAETIPAMLVVNLGLGGGSGKDIEQVVGADLTKYIAKGKVTIVDFYADWCGPCRAIGPFLEEQAKKDPVVVLRKVNVDKCPALAGKYKVRGIPHIMIFDKSGEPVETIVGANRAGVEQAITKAKAKS